MVTDLMMMFDDGELTGDDVSARHEQNYNPTIANYMHVLQQSQAISSSTALNPCPTTIHRGYKSYLLEGCGGNSLTTLLTS